MSTCIGATVGILSGYYGRLVDTGLMGFTDFMLTLPFPPLILVMGSVFEFTPTTITLTLVLLLWMNMARLVRGEVLSVREREYVQAARAVGASDVKIMLRHVLPNVVGVMVVQATLRSSFQLLPGMRVRSCRVPGAATATVAESRVFVPTRMRLVVKAATAGSRPALSVRYDRPSAPNA